MPEDKQREDIEWLQEKFQAETNDLTLPSSLSSQNLMHLLEGIEPEEPDSFQPERKVLPFFGEHWKPWAAAAVIAVIAAAAFQQFKDIGLTGAGMVDNSSSAASFSQKNGEDQGAPQVNITLASPSSSENKTPAQNNAADGMVYAGDYQQVRQALSGQAAQESVSVTEEMVTAQDSLPAEEEKPNPQVSAAEEMPLLGSSPGGQQKVTADSAVQTVRSEQNADVQVMEAGQSDRIKTDGESLFVYTDQGEESQVVIVDAKSMEKLSTISLEESHGVSELYISDETLVVMQTEAPRAIPFQKGISEAMASDNGSGSSQSDSQLQEEPQQGTERVISATFYDVTDRKKPKKTRHFEQDGEYISSHVSEGTLYIVSEKRVWQDPSDESVSLDQLVPVTGDSVQQESRLLEAKSILLCPDSSEKVYTVVSAIDVDEQSQSANTKAVLGYADGRYIHQDNIYLVEEDTPSGSEAKSNIVCMKLNGTNLEVAASGCVAGKMLQPVSMDEYNGYLRVLSTTGEGAESKTNLYVLDSQLTTVGKLEGLVLGQQVKSAQYLGDTAYVTVQQEKDPVLAVNLSNPRNPVIGEKLNISGFSNYVFYRTDSDTMIGIDAGTVTFETGETAENSVKLALFDIQDPLHPQDKKTFGLGSQKSYGSEENTKLFLYDQQDQWIGFPVASETYEKGSAYLLVQIFEGDGFPKMVSLEGEGVLRGIRVNDSFYVLCQNELQKYDMQEFQKTASVKL